MSAANVTISSDFRRLSPQVALGCLSATVAVHPSAPELLAQIDARTRELSGLTQNAIAAMPAIAAARAAYHACGKDPSRYRSSAEALIRRSASGKPLYHINNVVDINNLVSLRSGISIGCYDSARIEGEVVLRAGAPGETYKGIGKNVLNIEDLPLLADAAGPFGSPTSDSERTMIRPETAQLLMVLFSFGGSAGLNDWLEETAKLLAKFASAQISGKWIVTA